VRALVRLLRSASFARAVLIYLAALCGLAAWLPWVRGVAETPPPAWAVATGFDHPFSSPWFLAGVAALFASTFACTWGKRARTALLWGGELPATAQPLLPAPGCDLATFLRQRGFRGEGPLLFRHRWALWGGLLLHWGLLALIAGVAVQQAFHDEANFQLVPGERKSLSAPDAVFQRVAGPLAPRQPPDLAVALEAFDPFRHQAGYAPDRLSTLSLWRGADPPVTADVDRAAGVEVGGVTIHQAIPAGLAVVVETPHGERFALHLATAGERSAVHETRDPTGRVTRLVVTAENGIDDARGLGKVEARLEQGASSVVLSPGQPFVLGGNPMRIVSYTRWAGFSYSRSPGLAGVFAGFLLVLLGAALLTFPVGLARLPGSGENAALVWLPRGAEALRLEWERGAAEP